MLLYNTIMINPLPKNYEEYKNFIKSNNERKIIKDNIGGFV